jgi:general secretion pathway protein E
VAISAHGFRNSPKLNTAARALVLDGTTSPEEAIRVSRHEAIDA